MLFFHGNAGNIGARLPNIEILCKNLHTNVLIIDYRGYGHSTGEPSEEGLHLDAIATLDYCMNDDEIDSSRLFCFGRSLGGAVAVRLAMEHSNRFKGIIVENTFTSIGEMVDRLMPLVARFKAFIQRIYYPTIERIGSISAPLLLIRGEYDEIVPSDHS